MSKILLSVVIFTISVCVQSQTNTITDWNTLRTSGFYESETIKAINTPHSNSLWFWGINLAHSTNALAVDKPYYFGAQLLFEVNFALNNPKLYIRSTNANGLGVWAKVLTDKGDQEIGGKLKAREVEITITAGADHVFNTNYDLKPLSEVKAFVEENKHLPEIPSEKHMQENGLNVNEFQIKLLQKIEELTLYVIKQDEEIQKLKDALSEK